MKDFFYSSFSNFYLMEKVSALLSFLYPFPSEHCFCSHRCFPQWSSSPSSCPLPIRTEVTYVAKLQTWAFKPESMRLPFFFFFCLICPFHEHLGPSTWEWMSSILLVHTQKTDMCFLCMGRAGFCLHLLFNSLGEVFLFLVATLFLCS